MNPLRRFIKHRLQGKYWLVLEPAGTEGEYHVIPNNDTLHHEAVDCPCGTKTEAVMRADGSNGWLVVHYSLDGREALERR